MNGGIDTEQVLGQLRQWLDEVRHEAAALPDFEPEDAPPLTEVVAAFTALRHEVKLQTKGTRSLQEETGRVLEALSSATARFDSVKADEAQVARRAAEPFAESLAGLDEAVSRAVAACEQARRRTLEDELPRLRRELDATFRRQPFWKRWLSASFHRAVGATWLNEVDRATAAPWDALLDGYRLIGNRVKRALESHGVKRIACVGRPVDPHCMTVVEVRRDPELVPGTVLDELRPGYTWQDKILRFAEVRAVAGEEQRM